jgi:hypothetical protein
VYNVSPADAPRMMAARPSCRGVILLRSEGAVAADVVVVEFTLVIAVRCAVLRRKGVVGSEVVVCVVWDRSMKNGNPKEELPQVLTTGRDYSFHINWCIFLGLGYPPAGGIPRQRKIPTS